jgi:hypothetical protein
MVVFGVTLMIMGFVLATPLLWTVGSICALIGFAVWVLSSLGHKPGPRWRLRSSVGP